MPRITQVVSNVIAFLSGILPAALAGDGAFKVHGEWTPSLQAEETADDSDKTFTVPASTEWMIQSIWVELTTTADVGDRQIEVCLTDDSDDVIGAIQASIVQAASLTYNYLFSLTGEELYALRDGTYLQTALSAIILPAGFKIRVWDNNAVAVAADDMVVQMMVLARTV